MARMTKAQQAEQTEATNKLREILPVASKVYTVLNHVSRSGMLRHISILIGRDDEVQDITWLVARALDYKRDDRSGGLKVTGCGMDMGFHLVHSLSYALHGTKSQGTAVDARYFNDRTADAENFHAGYTLQHSWV